MQPRTTISLSGKEIYQDESMKRIGSLLEKKEETALNVFKLKTMLQENDTLAILIYGSPDPDAVA